MRFPLLALALCVVPVTASADPAPRPHPSPAISLQTLKDVTKTLSSDAYEGRKPMTASEAKATDYIVARFKAAGLKPGNPNAKGGASWFQDVPLVELTATDVTPLTFSGGKAPVTLKYRSDLVLATYRVTPKVKIADSPVVFVGYGITAPERGWDDYAGSTSTARPSSSWSTTPTGRRPAAPACSRARR